MALGITLLKDHPSRERALEPEVHRRTTQDAVATIKSRFQEVRVWTPAQLRQTTGLTHYQIKEALRQLVSAGVLVKTGSTQAVRYTRKEKEDTDASAA